MADSDASVRRLTENFHESIEALRRDGVPDYPPLGGRKPWAEASESRKLKEIVWESMTVWLGDGRFRSDSGGGEVIHVPGPASLATIERHIDYAKLPAAQREMLTELRARLDAGQIDAAAPQPYRDVIAATLERVVGVAGFDWHLAQLKEDQDRPWAEVPDGVKVHALVEAAQVDSAPAAYVLAAIEREVDYGKLPQWRRDGLERLRERLDKGEFDGEQGMPSYLSDRANRALALTELAARVEDEKRAGYVESEPWNSPWRKTGEEEKFAIIMREIHELDLEWEAAAYDVIAREVDLRHVRQMLGVTSGLKERNPSPGDIADSAPPPPAHEQNNGHSRGRGK